MIPSDSQAPSEYEATLRLLAQAPAPEALAERIQARLASAPQPSRWRKLFSAWALPQWDPLQAMAAAALVVIIVGGSLLIAARINAPAPANATAPRAVPSQQGFSSAGAVRKPQTVEGPAAPQASRTR